MKYILSIITLILLSLVGGVIVAHAQGYIPLAPLPGTLVEGSKTTNISTYVAGMIKLLVALGAALAVLFAIIGGTQYVAASINPSAKQNALEKVWNALIGLAIILSSYLLLNSINPDLVNFKLELPPVVVEHSTPSSGGGSESSNTDSSGCPTITDPRTLLTSPEAISMENSNGTAVIFSSGDPSVDANLKKLKTAANTLVLKLTSAPFVGVTAEITSAYRPYDYQKHLYEIYKAWVVDGLMNNTDPTCAESKALVGAEYSKHKLLGLVANPDGKAPHTVGRGVDISIKGISYSNFSALGNQHWRDVNSFMEYEGICLKWLNLPNDIVHFNLDTSRPPTCN